MTHGNARAVKLPATRINYVEPRMKLVQRVLSVIAMLFGIATLVAGLRVLLGADPGYAVYQPLLFFNTVMGVAYVAAGIAAWFSTSRGWRAALSIFGFNAIALAMIAYLHAVPGTVALESVQAMILRTAVWLVLALGLGWLDRRASIGIRS